MTETREYEITKRGSMVWAEFCPRRRDDLKPGAAAVIGRYGNFEYLWLIEEGDYAGQWAMGLPKSWGVEDSVWVPLQDIRIVS